MQVNVFYETSKIQDEQFNEYADLIVEWNKKINLTAITNREDIIIKHFIDSLSISKYINNNLKVIDIGTGAGFPGIPLKIYNPSLNITLLDSLNKRIKFLDTVIEELKLNNIRAIHGRAEEIARNDNYREKYDIVTSRAVSKLNTLVEYMLPFAKENGICICMKGPNIYEELDEAERAIKILGGKVEKVEEFFLPKTDIKRSVIIIRKIKKTNEKYPRNAGIPIKKPL